MSLLQPIRHTRCAPKVRNRKFAPTLDALESRQLLSLNLMSGAGDYPTQYAPPRTTQFLGQVSSDSFVDTKDTLSATVNWGDGTPSAFTANAGIVQYYGYPNNINVPGHTFQKSGNLTIHVTVQDQHGASISWDDHFTVADAGYTITQQELAPVGNASNVVGAVAPFMDTLVAPLNPSLTASIQVLSCSYTAYDAQGRVAKAFIVPTRNNIVDESGYHVSRVSTVSAANLIANSAWTEGVYWGSIPGTYKIKANISWSDLRGIHYANPVECTETVTQPTVTMTPTMNNQDGAMMEVQDGTSYILTTEGPDMGHRAMSLQASIDPNQHGVTGGNYGVVQTMVRNLFRWAPPSLKVRTYSTGGDTTSSLLDPTPWWETSNGNFTPYYGTPPLDANGDYVNDQSLANTIVTPAVTTWNVGNTLSGVIDSPYASMDTSSGYTAMSDSAVFTDTVMFTPSGGIPVPIASMQWGYRASLAFDANGDPVVLYPSAPDVLVEPAATVAYPTWVGLASDYRGKTPVPWTTPPTVS